MAEPSVGGQHANVNRWPPPERLKPVGSAQQWQPAPAGPPNTPRQSRQRTLGVVVALIVGLVVVVIIADSVIQANTTTRDLAVAGQGFGGLSSNEASEVLKRLEADYSTKQVVLSDGIRVIPTDAATVGLELDVAATVDQAMSMSRFGPIVSPESWLASITNQPRQVPLQTTMESKEGLSRLLTGASNQPDASPIEHVDGWMVATQAIDVERTAAALMQAASVAGSGPVEVPVVYRSERTGLAETVKVASEINALTADPVTVQVGDNAADLTPAMVRSWISSDGQTWTLDQDQVDQALRSIFGTLIVGPTGSSPQFGVKDGQVASVAAIEPLCCATDSAHRLVNAIVSGEAEVNVAVDLSTSSAAVAAAYGITEPIGSAVIDATCCDEQFHNAQIAADLVQGHILEPGEYLSLNELVGDPSTERGFKVASAPNDGSRTHQVGDGINILSTALFQAAFHAGLDIDDQYHQSYWQDHLVDRNGRRGLDASFEYPTTDLRLSNPTMYPVLIWTSYGQNALTVTLYSTSEIGVLAVEQVEQLDGACIEIKTERVRRFGDGTEQSDLISARYLPKGGDSCDPPPEPQQDSVRGDENGFLVAAPDSTVFGTGGTLVRYSVEVEAATGLDPGQVAAAIGQILADRRGWTAKGGYRFERVDSSDADVRMLVATPSTTDKLCLPLDTAGWLSCRNEQKMILNVNRWNGAIDHWDAPLDEYRAYLVNHELGHFLGLGHHQCGGEGQLAPVMMQQTKSIEPCVANGWPNP